MREGHSNWWGGKYGGGTRGKRGITGSKNPAVSTADFVSMDFATAENASSFVERTFCWVTTGWEEGVKV